MLLNVGNIVREPVNINIILFGKKECTFEQNKLIMDKISKRFKKIAEIY